MSESTSTTSPEESMDLSEVNPEILEAIFLRFPKKDLVKCSQVCHLWKNIINTRSFWVAKEDYEGETYLRSLIDTRKPILGNDFALLSIKRPYERGLLVHENPDGKTPVTRNADPRWYFNDGGNGWRYQEPPSFIESHFHRDFKPIFDSCHETSYGTCSKYFDLSIKDLGLTPEVMDNFRPPIVFSEWVTNRSDCGCLYRSSIQLFNENRHRIAWERQELSFDQWQYQLWQKVEVVMQSYPPGARSIRILSSGRDLQFWNGHYGPKMAGCQLMIKMEETPPPTQPFELGGLQDAPME
uniref:F-box domain-containing protein n=1 Tax=Panagrolaimus sp. PS1159 TaxID=55785 RepID=A0AC35G8D6_9BILA